MKILVVFGVVTVVLFLAGYGGVVSLEKSFGGASIEIGDATIPQVSALNESEHVECQLNESDSDALADVQKEAQSESITIGEVVFQTSLKSGIIMAKATGRPIFVYLHSRSCGWCRKFNDEVLIDSEVSSTLRTNFISVVVEVNEQKNVALDFNIWGTPTMVFLDETGNEIDRIRGFVDAETFTHTLEKIKESSVSNSKDNIQLSPDKISQNELSDLINGNRDFLLIDVRTEGEYDQGHLPGAIVIPYDEFVTRYREILEFKDTEIVLYCHVGGMGDYAGRVLLKNGFTNVKNLDGGINGWIKSGGKIV